MSWLVRGHLGKFKIKFSQSMAVFSGMIIIIFLKKKNPVIYIMCVWQSTVSVYISLGPDGDLE